MNLISVKTLDQIKLNGIKLAWEKHDGIVRTITLTDEAGNRATFSKANTYSDAIDIMIPEPPKMEDRWFLIGKFAGVNIKQAFDTEREAKMAKDDFPHDAELNVVKASIAVTSDGPVASEPDNLIPF